MRPMKALYKALMRPIKASKNPDELASSQEGLIMHAQPVLIAALS